MSVLRVADLSVQFDGVRANDDINLSVEADQIVGLVGPNGAGKTTLIDAVTGFVDSSGRLELDGEDLRSLRPHERARCGLTRTFQSLDLFEDVTVEDNLLVAAHRTRWYDAALDMFRPKRANRAMLDRVDRALELVGLEQVRTELPLNLSQGQRKLVGVARAIAAEPRVLLLDEPAAGLDTQESRALGEQLRELTRSGMSLLLVDHDMHLVLGVCDYIYVLDIGRVIAHGTPGDVRRNPEVIEAYLGESVQDVGDHPEPLEAPIGGDR